MQKDCTVFNIPGMIQTGSKSFDTPKEAEVPVEVTDIYTELNEIAEELEECRLRNC